MASKKRKPGRAWRKFARSDAALIDSRGIPALEAVIHVRMKPVGFDLELVFDPKLSAKKRRQLEEFFLDEMVMFERTDPLAPWTQLDDGSWELLIVREHDDWDIAELFDEGQESAPDAEASS